jgi:hypothetical protein
MSYLESMNSLQSTNFSVNYILQITNRIVRDRAMCPADREHCRGCSQLKRPTVNSGLRNVDLGFSKKVVVTLVITGFLQSVWKRAAADITVASMLRNCK